MCECSSGVCEEYWRVLFWGFSFTLLQFSREVDATVSLDSMPITFVTAIIGTAGLCLPRIYLDPDAACVGMSSQSDDQEVVPRV